MKTVTYLSTTLSHIYLLSERNHRKGSQKQKVTERGKDSKACLFLVATRYPILLQQCQAHRQNHHRRHHRRRHRRHHCRRRH